jgi:hypothetical protein
MAIREPTDFGDSNVNQANDGDQIAVSPQTGSQLAA